MRASISCRFQPSARPIYGILAEVRYQLATSFANRILLLGHCSVHSKVDKLRTGKPRLESWEAAKLVVMSPEWAILPAGSSDAAYLLRATSKAYAYRSYISSPDIKCRRIIHCLVESHASRALDARL